MNSLRTTARRALDRARRLPVRLRRTGRLPAMLMAAPPLVLAATLLVSPGPVGAVDPVPENRDPAARLQVVIKQVHVNDDNDWHGQGDMTLSVALLRCPLATSGCVPADQELLARSTTTFGANSGETVSLNRVFPHEDELVRDDEGYAVYAGERYVLHLSMVDRDSPGGSEDDRLGRIVTQVADSNGWRLGMHEDNNELKVTARCKDDDS